MATWHTLQDTFIEGILTPRLSSQVARDYVRNGLAEAVNAIITLQGTAIKRLGTQYITDLPEDSKDAARVWPFLDSSNRYALAVFTPSEVNIIATIDDAGVGLLSTENATALSGYHQTVVNPYFIQGSTGWKTSGNYTVDTTDYRAGASFFDTAELAVTMNDIRIEDPDKPFIRQKIRVPDSTNAFIFSTKVRKDNRDPQEGTTTKLRLKLSTTEGAGDLFQASYELADSFANLTDPITLAANVSGEIWMDLSLEIDGLTYEEGTAREIYSIFFSEVFMYSRSQGVLNPATLASPYGAPDLEELHFIQSPFDTKSLYILHPNYPPHEIFFDTGAGNYVIQPIVFADPAPEWGPANYPSVGTAHQGRLVLTGAVNDSETVWCSQVGNWLNFVPADAANLVPDDAITFTPTDRGVNTWITGFKALLFGNLTTEYSVRSQSGLLQPADVGVEQQSGYGSLRSPQKITVGNSVMLNSGGNTSLRKVRYSEENGGFIAADLLLKAEHLGLPLIRRFFHTRDPHDMLWCVMFDGTLITMSFDERDQVNAWNRIITDGEFVDGCKITDTAGRDVAVFIIERVVNGQTRRHLEVMNGLRATQTWRYLDSAVRVYAETSNAGTEVGGFGNLAGKEVHYFTDGHYTGTQVVSPTGTLLIEQDATIIDAGLSYEMLVSTFPQNSMNPSAGTGLKAKKRYTGVGARGLFTLPPIIEGQRNGTRSASSIMDIPEPAKFLEDVDVTTNNWDGTGTVTIQEPLPVPVVITGIYGKLATYEV